MLTQDELQFLPKLNEIDIKVAGFVHVKLTSDQQYQKLDDLCRHLTPTVVTGLLVDLGLPPKLAALLSNAVRNFVIRLIFGQHGLIRYNRSSALGAEALCTSKYGVFCGFCEGIMEQGILQRLDRIERALVLHFEGCNCLPSERSAIEDFLKKLKRDETTECNNKSEGMAEEE